MCELLLSLGKIKIQDVEQEYKQKINIKNDS